MKLDAITLTVLQYRFQQIADEMDVIFDRAAFSPIISEGRDRASGLFTADTGALIAQGATGIPIHIGAMHFGVGSIARKFAGKARPGEIYILNDPYMGGTHLQDVKLVMPIFHEGALFMYLAVCGHWADIGGAVPGGYVTDATEIQQEGLRMAGVRLFRNGVVDADMLELILDNVRVPAQRLGDLQAQVAALKAGEAAVLKLLGEYDGATISESIRELRVRACAMVREKVSKLRQGTYSSEDALDNDGIENTPVWVRLDLSVNDGGLVFDFSRSSPPCRGPLNGVYATTAAAVFIAFKHLFPDIPMNAGCFDALEVIAPDSTFLNAGYPKPVSGCAAEVSQRVVDACFGALAQFAPERVTGGTVGTSMNVALGGFDPVRQQHYIMYFYTGGGHGGFNGGDGISHASTSVGLARTPPVEIIEQHAPVLFEEYALRENSAGMGKFRGGFGLRYRFRLLRGDGKLTVMGDRSMKGPVGIFGGQPGAPSIVSLLLDGRPTRLLMGAKVGNVPFKAGDMLLVETPGGGGHGDVAERDPVRAAADLRRGYYVETA